MKGAILRLLLIVLFAAISGFAAQAQDTETYYVNYEVYENDSACNEDWFYVGHSVEWNMPEDGRHYVNGLLNGVSLHEIEYPLSGYTSISNIYFYFEYSYTLPYTWRRVDIFYSESWLMESRAFAFNLYCDANSQAHVWMEVLY